MARINIFPPKVAECSPGSGRFPRMMSATMIVGGNWNEHGDAEKGVQIPSSDAGSGNGIGGEQLNEAKASAIDALESCDRAHKIGACHARCSGLVIIIKPANWKRVMSWHGHQLHISAHDVGNDDGMSSWVAIGIGS